MSWNPLVPNERRIPTTMMTPGRPLARPSHVVCHITGTNSFSTVRKTFLNSASAHYVIDKAGLVYQFVREEDQAWHAGIQRVVKALYAQGPEVWRRYLYYFDWAKYPAGSVFVDAELAPTQGVRSATFVARPDGSAWPNYAYFDARWGANAAPLNYTAGSAPNAYSVGIEILSVGSTTPSQAAYAPAMYASLWQLVADICARHAIPMEKGRFVGHEDVNPVQRYGWDPNQGFDWPRVWA